MFETDCKNFCFKVKRILRYVPVRFFSYYPESLFSTELNLFTELKNYRLNKDRY